MSEFFFSFLNKIRHFLFLLNHIVHKCILYIFFWIYNSWTARKKIPLTVWTIKPKLAHVSCAIKRFLRRARGFSSNETLLCLCRQQNRSIHWLPFALFFLLKNSLSICYICKNSISNNSTTAAKQTARRKKNISIFLKEEEKKWSCSIAENTAGSLFQLLCEFCLCFLSLVCPFQACLTVAAVVSHFLLFLLSLCLRTIHSSHVDFPIGCSFFRNFSFSIIWRLCIQYIHIYIYLFVALFKFSLNANGIKWDYFLWEKKRELNLLPLSFFFAPFVTFFLHSNVFFFSLFEKKNIDLFAIREFVFYVGEKQRGRMKKHTHTHTKHIFSKTDLSPFVKPDLNIVV